MSGRVWVLLTAGRGQGVARELATALSAGVHGQALRRAEVAGAGPDLTLSARTAAAEVLPILYRERYLDRQIVVRFAAEEFGNVQGRSAELAFALGVAAAAVSQELPPVAATGTVEAGGAIGAVEGLAEKLAAALAILPPGGVFAFPAVGESVLPPALRKAAADAGVALLPVWRLEDALARLGLAITRTWLENPFRGLEPFGFGDASVFFGRAAEIESLSALLIRRGAILVQGPSGVGKSSLVQAGLLPALIRRDPAGSERRWGLIRPRDLPADPDAAREVADLVPAIARAFCHAAEGGLGEAAAEGPLPEGGAPALAAWLRDWGALRPVLVVDQLEELFEPRLTPANAEAFATLLAALADTGVALVCTMTAAALPQLAALPRLDALFGIEGRHLMEPRHDAALMEAVIRAPAEAAGLSYEPGLEAELIAVASHGGVDVLPLLELLLTELYERRDAAAAELRWSDYRAVGGLDGVVSSRADVVYRGLDADAQAAVPALLWLLLTHGAVAGTNAPDHPLQRVLAAYQARRLLVRDTGGTAGEFRAAHEALLRHWRRAVDFRQEYEADLMLWTDLMREALQSARGERALIPAGPQLDAAVALVHRRQGLWTAEEGRTIIYVDRSQHARQRRHLVLGAVAAVPLLVGVGWSGAVARRAWLARFETRISFNDISVPGPDYVIAGEPYLNRFGITVPDRTPADARLEIVNNLGFYNGRGADPVAGQNFLTQSTATPAAPIDFTLAFAHPPKRVGLLRAALWAATASGVTHAAWRMDALDAKRNVIGSVSEDLLRGMLNDQGDIVLLNLEAQPIKTLGGRVIPAQMFTVADNGEPLASVRITGDNRLGGRYFAGTQSVLINELVLYYD
ncbi:MAG: hypothetical protein GC186_15685 [Rhodobacteraceae bacterium]|nr:hypothetical protein [Paracoccaceae bacterium]